MFEKSLRDNFPFATSFFEAALKTNSGNGSKKLSHAFLLTGNDPAAQYLLALNVAKQLNCEREDKAEFCDCTSCSWLAKNRHPAVITVSPVDLYHVNKDKKPQKNISVNQAAFVRSELLNTSQYHRVVIFTNAKEGKEYLKDVNNVCKDYNLVCPKNYDDDSERIWVPAPLDSMVFEEKAANSLLKSIEEPGDNITFFFLAKDKEDMINTIVSRCQTVPVVSKDIKTADISYLKELLNIFPPKDEREAILMAESVIEMSKGMNLKLEDILDSFQEYLRQVLSSNSGNKYLVSKLAQSLRCFEESKKSLRSIVNPNSVLETLFLEMVRLY